MNDPVFIPDIMLRDPKTGEYIPYEASRERLSPDE